MKHWSKIITAVALFAAITVHAGEGKHAGGPGGPGGMHNEGLLPAKVLGDLALTADQQTKYDAIAAAYDKDRAAWLATNKTQMDALKQQADAAKTANDQAKMKEVRTQMHDQMKGLGQVRKTYVDQVTAILTDDQKTKLAAAGKEHHGDHKGPKKA